MFTTNICVWLPPPQEQDREKIHGESRSSIESEGWVASSKGVWEGIGRMESRSVMCQASHYIFCVCTHVEDTSYGSPSPEASRGQWFNRAYGTDCLWEGHTSLFWFQGQTRQEREYRRQYREPWGLYVHTSKQEDTFSPNSLQYWGSIFGCFGSLSLCQMPSPKNLCMANLPVPYSTWPTSVPYLSTLASLRLLSLDKTTSLHPVLWAQCCWWIPPLPCFYLKTTF